MSDRIIFLDFDGVLNTTEFLRRSALRTSGTGRITWERPPPKP